MSTVNNRPTIFFFAASAAAALVALILVFLPFAGPSPTNSLGYWAQLGLLLASFIVFSLLCGAVSRVAAFRTLLSGLQTRVNQSSTRLALKWLFAILLAVFGALVLAVIVLPELFPALSPLVRFFPLWVFATLLCANAVFVLFVGQGFWDHVEVSPLFIAVVAFIVAFVIIYLPLFLFEANQLNITISVAMPDAIGNDLRRTLGWSQTLFSDHQYVGPYPPFPLLFFSPLLLLPGPLAYRIIVMIAFACYLLTAYVFPWLMANKEKVKGLMLLWGGLGLFSYGLTFELQAGQFTLLTFVFALLAVYLFHFKKNWRWLAYVFLTMAIQLKLWPGIFLFMLVDDWQDWRANLRRFVAVLIPNFLLLFIFGLDGFVHFVTNLSGEQIGNFWVGNHSAVSFLTGLTGLPDWVQSNIGLVSALSVLGVLVALVLVHVLSIRRKQTGFVPVVFLVSSLAALLIPSLSNDYRLPILVAPMALYFASVITPQSWSRRIILSLVLFVIALAYSFTFFPTGFKPGIFENNFPALYTMLVLVPVSYWLSDHPTA